MDIGTGSPSGPRATMLARAPIQSFAAPSPSRRKAQACTCRRSEIAVAPGAGFGEYGDNYVRIALVENEHRIRQAARNVKKFLSSPPIDLAAIQNRTAAQ